MTIHVLCLNPAIDKLYMIDGFEAGEDYPGQRPQVRIGGKGVNVARVLSQLGSSVHLYALLGEESERSFRREMEARCACTFIPVPGACRTTINVIDRKSGRETVITESGPQVSAEHVQALMDALEENVCAGDIVCCSGSIIAGAPEDIYAQISRLVEKKGARCALDCNAKALPASLKDARYVLGKPNERELCALLGEERTKKPEEIVELARRLLTTYKPMYESVHEPAYEALVVSMGAAGGMWVDSERALRAKVPQVEVKSTVGSGDAAFAGALHAMAEGRQPDEALRLSMACGAANAMLGEVGSVRMEDVREIQKQIVVTAIQK